MLHGSEKQFNASTLGKYNGEHTKRTHDIPIHWLFIEMALWKHSEKGALDAKIS